MDVLPGTAVARGLVDTGAAVARGLPVNMKLFGQTILGNRTTITERSFDPATLNSLRTAAADAEARRLQDIAVRRDVLRQVKQQASRPDAWFGWTMDDKGRRQDISPQKVVADAQQALMRAQRPATIQYENYADRPLNDEGWLEGVKRSYTDPEWRAQTAIGRARLERDAQGNTVVVDTHDWNGGKFVRQGFREDPLGTLGEIIGALRHPTTAGNVIGAIFAPAENKPRQVRVNLGKVQPADRRGL